MVRSRHQSAESTLSQHLSRADVDSPTGLQQRRSSQRNLALPLYAHEGWTQHVHCHELEDVRWSPEQLVASNDAAGGDGGGGGGGDGARMVKSAVTGSVGLALLSASQLEASL